VFIDDRYRFSGNTLATFWNMNLNNSLSKDMMQGLAKEINFSETTFVFPSEDYLAKVRIFTPGIEIPFAGHPTLGTTYVLQESSILDKNIQEIQLELAIGPIKVEILEDNFFNMIQPEPQFLGKFDDLSKLAEILNIKTSEIDDSLTPQYVSTGLPYLFVPIKTLKAITSIEINIRLLKDYLKNCEIEDIVVFTKETVHKDSHVHMRMFAPFAGINEDPATGSAAGPVSAFLEKNSYLESHDISSEIIIEQGYEIKRPSKLVTSIIGNRRNIKGVNVGGKVKKLMEGSYFI
jgi:trans-2,3-dihydro-3-hydroxyanthranilate isomerase